MKFVMKLFARVVAILIDVAVCPGTGAFAQMPPQEQVAILELPPVSPHRVAATSFDGFDYGYADHAYRRRFIKGGGHDPFTLFGL
jgi:hypothetical protein